MDRDFARLFTNDLEQQFGVRPEHVDASTIAFVYRSIEGVIHLNSKKVELDAVYFHGDTVEELNKILHWLGTGLHAKKDDFPSHPNKLFYFAIIYDVGMGGFSPYYKKVTSIAEIGPILIGVDFPENSPYAGFLSPSEKKAWEDRKSLISYQEKSPLFRKFRPEMANAARDALSIVDYMNMTPVSKWKTIAHRSPLSHVWKKVFAAKRKSIMEITNMVLGGELSPFRSLCVGASVRPEDVKEAHFNRNTMESLLSGDEKAIRTAMFDAWGVPMEIFIPHASPPYLDIGPEWRKKELASFLKTFEPRADESAVMLTVREWIMELSAWIGALEHNADYIGIIVDNFADIFGGEFRTITV